MTGTLKTVVLPGVCALTLMACGGGGGGDAPVTPPPPAANSAPEVTSAATAATNENETGVVYTVTARDAESDTLTFGVEGADAGALAINAATGALRFARAPDFEAPSDADADNVYNITVTATDPSGAVGRQAVALAVLDLEPLPEFTRVVEGLDFPTYAAELPGTDRLLVLEKRGRLRLADPDTGVIDANDFLVPSDLGSEGEGGVLGFAVPGDFATSRLIYIYLTNARQDSEVRRYRVSADGRRADPASMETVIRVDQPDRFANHRAGWIGFDANGFLVVPLGDGGGAGDPDNRAQDPQDLLGKVLRLDVSGDAFPDDPVRNYAIPPGNTFADARDGRPEIFAMGLRNPFRSSFDPLTGDLLIADVGQNAREEINRLPMDDSSLNFGWNIREGTLGFRGDQAGLTAPIAEYEHGSGPFQGNSITGGVAYNGEAPATRDAYIFADFASGNIWSIPLDTPQGAALFGSDLNSLSENLRSGTPRPSGVVSFATDSTGRLFVATIDGNIFRLDESE